MSRFLQWLVVFSSAALMTDVRALYLATYEDLIIEIVQVEVIDEYQNRRVVEFGTPMSISLKAFDPEVLVEIIDFDPGVYSEVNFKVNAKPLTLDSIIIVEDRVESIYLDQEMLRLKGPFNVDCSGNVDFELDMREVISAPDNGFGDFEVKQELKIIDYNDY